MSSPEITVWAQRLGSGWQPIGSDSGTELIPESVEYECVRLGGSSAASFKLRRHTRSAWEDLSPFTPILIQLGGVNVWRGRIVRTPKQRGSESVFNVECEGMYQHLADDITNKGYVHDGSAGWFDARQISANVATFLGPGSVENDRFGQLLIYLPKGASVTITVDLLGLVWDAGVGNTIETVYLDWASSATGTGYDIIVRGSDDGTTSTGEATIIDSLATAAATDTVTFAVPRRYVMVYLNRVGATTTLTGNAWWRANVVRLFSSSAYNSSGNSVLKQSDVIKADLTANCPLVSSDQSLISTTSVSIPSFWPGAYQTTADRLKSVSYYDAYDFSLTPEPVPRPKLAAIPTTPVWVYDASADGGTFEDAGANDGMETFNRAIVPYVNSAGVPQDTTYTTETNTLTFTNPGFEVDTSNWTAGTSTTVSRSTAAGSRYSGVAGGGIAASIDNLASINTYTTAFSAALIVGRRYTVRGYVKAGGTPSQMGARLRCANSGDTVEYTTTDSNGAVSSTTWTPMSCTFVATDTTLRVTLTAYGINDLIDTGQGMSLDAFTIELKGDTIIDRRGFNRTAELNADTSTSTAAAALADAFLDTHKYPPFRGSLNLTGYARKWKTNEYIPVGQLPAGDALMVVDEIDPTTGAVGRMGIIERVAYSHDSLEAQVDLDSRQDIIDQLLLASRGL